MSDQSPGEVWKIVAAVAGRHPLEYHEVPEAVEWRTSQRERAGSAQA